LVKDFCPKKVFVTDFYGIFRGFLLDFWGVFAWGFWQIFGTK